MTVTAAGLVQSIDWLALAPPTLAAVAALAVLVADLFTADHRKALLGWIPVAGLALAVLSLLPLLDGDRATFCRTGHASVCSYTADRFALVVQLLVLGGALLTALLSVTTLRDAHRRGARNRDAHTEGAHAEDAHAQDTRTTAIPDGEYWFLLLSSAAGAALLPAARDLATLVVALEVASLPAFALVGLVRGERRSAEAALKFFLSSVAATAVTLMGASFVYGATGSLYLTEIAARLPQTGGQLHTLAQTGVALTLVGFAFKTAAVPFHFWVPDTYVGAPLPVAAYLSVVGKAVGFSGLVLVTVIGFPSYARVWGPALAVLAALTMSVGNVAALRQRATRAYSAVRLLAWSSVGQAGYLLVPIAAAGYVRRGGDQEHAVGSTVAYALMYAAVNLGAFTVVVLVARSSRYNRISDYRGLYARRPLTALLLGFFLLCLAGLPPGVVGLFAKVTVFSAVVDAGLGWLAVVMAVNVVIALYYYLQWTAVLFRASDVPVPVPVPVPGGSGGSGAPGATPGVPGASPAPRAPRAPVPAADGAVPGPLAAALALTAALAVALSGAPQLILRFASGGLF